MWNQWNIRKVFHQTTLDKIEGVINTYLTPEERTEALNRASAAAAPTETDTRKRAIDAVIGQPTAKKTMLQDPRRAAAASPLTAPPAPPSQEMSVLLGILSAPDIASRADLQPLVASIRAEVVVPMSQEQAKVVIANAVQRLHAALVAPPPPTMQTFAPPPPISMSLPPPPAVGMSFLPPPPPPVMSHPMSMPQPVWSSQPPPPMHAAAPVASLPPPPPRTAREMAQTEVRRQGSSSMPDARLDNTRAALCTNGLPLLAHSILTLLDHSLCATCASLCRTCSDVIARTCCCPLHSCWHLPPSRRST